MALSCAHPASELVVLKDRQFEKPVCRACRREYMRAYRSKDRPMPQRRRRPSSELVPPTIWPELARRPW